MSVVFGEAESFCASAAKATGAIVLSNDSDFTLLTDMQEGSMVGLLRTMSLIAGEQHSNITIQCWRPKDIIEKLGTQNLARVAFERAHDPTASFATILQRSQTQELDTLQKRLDFDHFSEQFRSPSNAPKLKLNGFDPRLAELTCQIAKVVDHASVDGVPQFWVTLPVLLEDPSKDASWAYGREMRRLTYSLLVASQRRLSEGNQGVKVAESIRKGQRVVQDPVDVISAVDLSEAISNCAVNLEPLSDSILPYKISKSDKPRIYILWAVQSVLKQRAATGKNAMPQAVINNYVGIANHPTGPSSTEKKTQSHRLDAEWQLLHLNGNVQSVLYSLRLLKQACLFFKDTPTRKDHEAGIDRLIHLTGPMPPIQDLFLDVDSVKNLLRRSPLSSIERAALGITPVTRKTAPTATLSNTRLLHSPAPMVEVVRKRKMQSKSNDNNSTRDSTKQLKGSQQAASSNPFDVLMDRG